MSNVIQMEDMRLTLKRGAFHSLEGCRHLNFTMDCNGGIVTCDDCDKQLSAFWVLTMLADVYCKARDEINARVRQQKEVEQKTLHLKASQEVERAWRSKRMVPLCPHCHEPIYPTDGFGGSCVNKEIAASRRARLQAERAAQRAAKETTP